MFVMVEGFILHLKTHKAMFHFQKLNYHSLDSISKLTKQIIIIFSKNEILLLKF